MVVEHQRITDFTINAPYVAIPNEHFTINVPYLAILNEGFQLMYHI